MDRFAKVGLTIWIFWMIGLFVLTKPLQPAPEWYQAIPLLLLVLPIPILMIAAKVARHFEK